MEEPKITMQEVKDLMDDVEEGTLEEYDVTPAKIRAFLDTQDEDERIDVADPESWVLARILLSEGKDEPHVLIGTLQYEETGLSEPVAFEVPGWYQDLTWLLLDEYENTDDGSCFLLPSEITDMMDAIDRGEKVPLD